MEKRAKVTFGYHIHFRGGGEEGMTFWGEKKEGWAILSQISFWVNSLGIKVG